MTDESPAERRKRLHRERQARYLERKRAEQAATTAAEGHAQKAERVQEAARPTKASVQADRSRVRSPILGVFSFPSPGGVERGIGFETHYLQGRDPEIPTYKQWLDIPYEEKPKPAVVVTPTGRYSYITSDSSDIARVATLAAEELGLDERDIRATLSRVAAGAVFTLGGPV